MVRKILCGMSADEIFSLIKPSGFTYSHALLIANSLYKKGVTEFTQMKKIQGKLICELSFGSVMGKYLPTSSEISIDKTIKYLFKTGEGKLFETVYIPDKKRNTVCVSTQSGCRMGCPFCVTGEYGFFGNLSAGEIVNQVISIPEAQSVTHVVFMGMGEPMDNLENVLKACEILTSSWGLALSPRNITVSTVGLTPGVESFLRESECNLALSLYSPFKEEREVAVPAEKRFPAFEILEIMKNKPLKRKRRLSVAYVMINGLNDTDAHLIGLKKLLAGTKIRVNLLPYHENSNDNKTSSFPERMEYFKHNLVISGVSASIRKSRGVDISAACGLLATGLRNDPKY